MIWSVFLAAGIGLFSGFAWWAMFRPVSSSLGRMLLRPSRRKPRQRWLKATQFVLSGQLPMAFWIALVLPSPIMHGIFSLFLPGWIAAVGGVCVLVAVVLELASGSRNRYAVERTLLPVAVDNLLAHASLDYSTRMLEYTLHSPDPVFRLAAVKGLSSLGTHSALRLLAQSCNDPDHEVRTASERGAESIRRALGDDKPLSTTVMPKLFKEHAYWTEKLDNLSGQDFKAAGRRIIEFEHSMTEIVNSQMVLRTAFPEVFCLDCASRLVENRYARWRYVHCPRCGDVIHAKAGVRAVIGRIGKRSSAVEKRDLVIDLWNNANQSPVFAEIDVLEITNDAGMDLEWAVNGVVNMLVERWPSRSHPIEVRLFGEPKLSENAKRLLAGLQA